MIGDGFQGGADNLRAAAAPRQADDGAAGVLIPIGRAQADKGRHNIDVIAAIDAGGDGFAFGGRVNQPQFIAQPLHGRPRREDAAFQRVLRGLFAHLPGDGRQQIVGRGLRRFPRIHQHKAASAVGVFGHAGLIGRLAKGRRLLVAGHPGNRYWPAKPFGFAFAI